MKRLGLMLLLFIELAVAAMFAIALRYGRFDQGAGFYFYLAGPILILSAAAAASLPVEPLHRAGMHGLLLLGCLAFALPFVWLVGTSFKYEDEIFVYPPKWIPSTPGTIARSPYVSVDAFVEMDRPAPMDAPRWDALREKLADAIWERSRKFADPDTANDLDPRALREATIRGLWNRAAASVSDAVWSGDPAKIIPAVVDRIDAEAAQSVRDASVLSVALGEVTVADDDGIEHRAAGGWTVGEGDGRIVPAPKQTSGVSYDLTKSPRVVLVGDFALPTEAARLLSVRLPMRQDRSWNGMRLIIEAGGKRYEAEDPLYLGQKRWQELTFRLKSKDDRDERDVGIWPLVLAKDQTSACAEAGKMKLTLAIERASPPSAAWRKYTANYVQAYLASGQRWAYVRNSLYLVVLSMLGQVLSCSMVAYAFAHIRFPGRDILFFILLATMMLPGQVTMIPTFLIYKHLGWYNTLRALWVPSFLGSAFFIFMLRQFMKSIPTELEEAARIDGCGYAGIYWRIILPVMKPALAAVAIFTFMHTWNDFMGPLIYINDQRLYPLSLGLFDFRTQHGAEYGMLMAASTLMTLPVIALFFVAQRYFIQGITLTGMKA